MIIITLFFFLSPKKPYPLIFNRVVKLFLGKSWLCWWNYNQRSQLTLHAWKGSETIEVQVSFIFFLSSDLFFVFWRFSHSHGSMNTYEATIDRTLWTHERIVWEDRIIWWFHTIISSLLRVLLTSFPSQSSKTRFGSTNFAPSWEANCFWIWRKRITFVSNLFNSERRIMNLKCGISLSFTSKESEEKETKRRKSLK